MSGEPIGPARQRTSSCFSIDSVTWLNEIQVDHAVGARLARQVRLERKSRSKTDPWSDADMRQVTKDAWWFPQDDLFPGALEPFKEEEKQQQNWDEDSDPDIPAECGKWSLHPDSRKWGGASIAGLAHLGDSRFSFSSITSSPIPTRRHAASVPVSPATLMLDSAVTLTNSPLSADAEAVAAIEKRKQKKKDKKKAKKEAAKASQCEPSSESSSPVTAASTAPGSTVDDDWQRQARCTEDWKPLSRSQRRRVQRKKRQFYESQAKEKNPDMSRCSSESLEAA